MNLLVQLLGTMMFLVAAILSSIPLAEPAHAAMQTQCTPSQMLSPSQPSKEYIYLSGRVLATEEPGNCATPPVSNTPVITSLSRTPAGTAPNVAAPGERFTLIIKGANLAAVNAVNFTPANIISVTNVVPSTDGTQVTATVNVPQSARTGSYDVSVSTAATPPLTSNILQFAVQVPGSPTIFNLNPSSVVAGNPPQTVTISATGFTASSVVLVNGVSRSPVQGSVNVANGTLQFILSQTELAVPTSFDISVANLDPGDPSGFAASASLPFTVTEPSSGPPNPVPVLTSVVPNVVTAGHPGPLSVSGTGFVPATEILVNGIARGLAANGIQLTQADVAQAGSLRISVFTPAPGGGLSNQLSVTIAPPSTYFALSLDGSSWVDVTNNSALNLNQSDGSFTAEAWIKTTSTSTQGIVEHYTVGALKGSNNGGFALRMLGSGKVRFFTFQSDTAAGTDAITSPATSLVNDGNWHHVAGVFAANAPAPDTPGEPGVMTLYIDGQPVASSTTVGFTARSPQPSTTDLFIGAVSGGTQPFNGEIDGVRISSAAVYTGAFLPNQQSVQIPSVTASTVALWSFDNQDLTDSANVANPPGALNGHFMTTGTFTTPQFLKNAPGGPPTANSILLDGASWALVPSDPTMDMTAPFTVEAWVKPATTSAQQAIVERYAATPGAGGGFSLDLLPGGNVSFSVYRNIGTVDTVTSSGSVPLDSHWHHVAGVFDGTNINIYLDGTQAGSNPGRTPRTNAANLLIGASEIRGASGTAGFFTGNIDEVRISSGTVYTGAGPGLSGIPTSLTVSSQTRALWKFDDLTLKDSSPNHNDGIRKKHLEFSSDVPGSNATTFVVEDLGVTSGFDLLSLSQQSATQGDPQFTLSIPGSNLTGAAGVTITQPTFGTIGVTASFAGVSGGQANLAVNPIPVAAPAGAYLITLNDSNNNPLGSIVFNVNAPQPNPVPFLNPNGLSPSTVQVGSPTIQLQVSGGNFMNGSVVLFNGSARATTYDPTNPGTLTAQILSTDLVSVGSMIVGVTNPVGGGGGGGSALTTLTLNVSGLTSNPAPVLTSILPTSAQTTTAPIPLRVLGKNFVNGSQIVFNGKLRTDTSFVTTNELDVTLSNSDIANPGTQPISVPVAVSTPAPGGGITSPIFFTINPINPVPAVTSLTVGGNPPNVIAGGQPFTLTVNGTNFVNSASTVRVNQSNRITGYVSSTQLTAQIPASDIASPGSISIDVVTQPPGGGTSNPISLTVNPPGNPVPVATSVSPSSVQVDSPGQAVVVTGTNFISGSEVIVNGSPRPTIFNSSDPTHLTAQLSSSDFAVLGQLAIKVFNPEPVGGMSSTVNLTVSAPAPTLTAISPTSVPAGSGPTSVVLTGTNFIDESLAQVNGSTRSSILNTPTQITMTLNAGDTASGAQLPITVTNPGPGGGTTAAITFTVVNPAPSLDATTPLTPASVLAGGGSQTITVLGAGFVPTSSVTINGTNRATFVDPTHLSVALQAADIASGGTIPFTVVNGTPGGGSSSTVLLTVNNPVPALDPNTPLIPAIVLTGSGSQTITVLGTNFVPTSIVNINGSNRATFVDPSHLIVALQSSDLTVGGTIPVTVVNPAPGGGTSATVNLMVNNPVPTVAGLSQTSATTGVAPFQITVLGTNFVGNSTVQFKGANHTPLPGSDSFNLIIQLTTADLSAAGTFQVTVTNPAPGGGLSATSATFSVIDPPPNPPVVTGVSPNHATIGQTPPPAVTITGQNFISGSVVMINGVAHTPAANSTTTQLFIQLSPDPDLDATAAVYPVTVVTPAPGGVSAVNPPATDFTLNNPMPTMSTTAPLSPASVIAGAGAINVDIYGTGFVPASTASFKGQSRTTTYVSPTHLQISLPAGDTAIAGNGPVTVVNSAPGGGSATVTFTINNPLPTLSSLSRTSATAGSAGFTLTVTGSNFVNSSVVQVNGAGRTTTFISPTQLSAAIPASDLATTANLSITVFNPAPGGGSSSALTFTVTAANNPQPFISSISPSNVFAGGSSFTLTITGSGFVSNSVVSVGAGNNSGPRTTTFVNSTQLTVQITSSDIATSGTQINIWVTNPAPGGGMSNQVTLNVQ